MHVHMLNEGRYEIINIETARIGVGAMYTYIGIDAYLTSSFLYVLSLCRIGVVSRSGVEKRTSVAPVS